MANPKKGRSTDVIRVPIPLYKMLKNYKALNGSYDDAIVISNATIEKLKKRVNPESGNIDSLQRRIDSQGEIIIDQDEQIQSLEHELFMIRDNRDRLMIQAQRMQSELEQLRGSDDDKPSWWNRLMG